MRILYLDHYAGSAQMGMEFRPFYLAREWARMGHEVTLVAGDYSHLRIENPTVAEDFEERRREGITYCWVRTGSYEGNGAARAFSMFRFVGKLRAHATQLARRYRPDVVIASSTYPLDTYAAHAIAKAAGARYVHEVHDMWPSTLYEVGGMSRHHPFVELMQRAENSAYRHCDLLVSLLPYTLGYMVQHGLDAHKFVNIQNGVVLSEWENPAPLPPEHARLFDALADKFVVGYVGGHATSNALDVLLDAAALEASDEVAFVLVGDGEQKARLVARAEREGLDNVHFLPPVPKAVVGSVLARVDISYMGGMDSPLYRFGLCLNKMYDSMMSATPILCCYDAPRTLVGQYQCGLEIPPEPVTNIVEAIDMLRSLSADDRRRIGERGRRAVMEHYTYDKLARQFMDALEGGNAQKRPTDQPKGPRARA